MSETILSWAKRSLFSIKSYCAKQRGGASLRPVARIQIEFLFADVLVNDGLQRAVGGQFGQRLVDLLQQVGKVSDFDRAAPHGTGHVKAGLNYAMSLHAIVTAHGEGYDENMYLDAATRTKVEETGGANFIFVTKDNKVVTPKSSTILPSITRRSLMYVAEHYLGLEVEEREVYLDEVKDFAECGLCGTAAVISPVGKIVDHGKEICFPSGMEEMGPVTKKLYETLTGIQMGHIEAPEGWICKIC